MADIKPLYRKTVGQARLLGELDAWRASFRENIACAAEIDAEINAGFDGMHLKDGIAEHIVDRYGSDRVAWVLAATLHEKEYDGRFSARNKAWGEAQRISWDDHAYQYCCNAHSVLVNAFIDEFRKLQQAQAQTPETMKIRIYQINHDRDAQHIKFCGLEELGDRKIDPSIYDRVFVGEIEGTTLEDVFRRFNTEGHPLHRGHSLSVSDIVELCEPVGDNSAGFYFCDNVGFQKVDFDPSLAQAPENLCRILYIEPHRAPYESEIVDELHSLQRAVGGMIEFTYPFEDNAMICGNEEAKLEGLEGNRRVFGSVYCGNLFIIGGDEEGGCISLTDEQMQKYGEMFAQPEDISPVEAQADTGFIFYGF